MDWIFRTIHGSHLYGTAHPRSDRDIYTVVPGDARTRHQVNEAEGTDNVVVSWDRYLELVRTGSHQAVEALFSPFQEWNPDHQALRPFLLSHRVYSPEVEDKYSRTIWAFCHGDLKRRCHAVRLAWNLKSLRAIGRFNPRLSVSDIVAMERIALNYEGEELWTTLSL